MSVAFRHTILVAVPAAACALALLPSAPASGQGNLQTARNAAASLRAAVAAETSKVEATQEGVQQAQTRLSTLEQRANTRQVQLRDTQIKLVKARAHLTKLQDKEVRDEKLLAANLVAAYEAGPATYISLVMDANGFADLLERMTFIKRVAHRNASILDVTRRSRVAVQGQTKSLDALRSTYSGLAKAAIDDRNEEAVVRTALLNREAQQLATRNGTAARLATVKHKISVIEAQQAAAARAAELAASAAAEAPREPLSAGTTAGVSTGAGGGDAVVARVVAAANQIATTPYVWGGGHGGFASGGFDCSGSVSYALAAGGLLNGSLTSTGFESWGLPGPGRRITVYANAGHAFMIVDGRRFDTVALSEYGTRWTNVPTSTAGFVARHPAGL